GAELAGRADRRDRVAVDEKVRGVGGTAERGMDARVADDQARRRHLPAARSGPAAVWRGAARRVKTRVSAGRGLDQADVDGNPRARYAISATDSRGRLS